MKKLPNIVTRILAGIVFVGVLLAGILINQYTFALAFSILIGMGLYEFYGLIEKANNIRVSKLLNIIGGLSLFIGVFSYSSSKGSSYIDSLFFYLIPYVVFIFALIISELYLKRGNPLQSLAYSFLGQMYIAVPFTLTNKLVFTGFEEGYEFVLILSVLIFIWVNDSFAYLTGMAFGKHRLFERISPKKSWEGFIGGFIFAVASSLIFVYFHPLTSVGIWIGFAVVVVIFGTFGDLVESLFKRTLGIKDSGKIIPGHGGILDRFDSTILAIPAAAVYLEIASYL